MSQQCHILHFSYYQYSSVPLAVCMRVQNVEEKATLQKSNGQEGKLQKPLRSQVVYS